LPAGSDPDRLRNKSERTERDRRKNVSEWPINPLENALAHEKPAAISRAAGAASGTGRKRKSGSARMMVTLPPDYRPSDDEEFMNPVQTEYFRQKLLRWRASLLREADGTLASLSEGGIHEADITDRASVETDRALELRTRDRARKLIAKIDQALLRIESGSYGYCEETGEPIGIKRLEARPIATLSIEAQERHERMERVHRDD
jgi:DnaK suppressor protein